MTDSRKKEEESYKMQYVPSGAYGLLDENNDLLKVDSVKFSAVMLITNKKDKTMLADFNIYNGADTHLHLLQK